MKKILFVNKSFAIGGIQSSMINMVNTLSNDNEVYLFVYYPVGPLKKRLSKNVRIIQSNWMFQAIGMSFKDCMKKGTFKQIVFRILATIWTKLFDNKLPIKLAIKKQKPLGYFDYAIAYHHEFSKKSLTSGFNRVLLNLVVSNNKVSWIHNDCVSNPIDEKFNDYYYSKMNKIVCVSNAVRESFFYKHPNINKKNIRVCHNFLDFTNIDSMSNQKTDIVFESHKLILFSACRLVEVKAFPRAIRAFASTFKENDIVWYIAGDGDERNIIESEINKCKLNDKIFLIGNQPNPYNYMKNSDALILCSYYEAAPMLYSEAKYLKKPVFTTKISSSYEMLDNGNYGYICENNEEDMSTKFDEFIKNETIINDIKKNLNSLKYNKESMIEEFNNIFK